MIYLYAFLDGEPPTPPSAGLDDAPVTTVRRGRVAAVCSDHVRPPVQPTTARLLRHENVVEQLLGDRGVLPARFGTTVADREALLSMLERHETALADALRDVRGRVEIAVRVEREHPAGPPTEPPPSRPATGTDYMQARVRARDDARRLTDPAHEGIAAVSAAATRELVPEPGVLMRAAYLVDRDEVDGVRSTVARIATGMAALDVVCSGPWPPYSFAPVLVETERRRGSAA